MAGLFGFFGGKSKDAEAVNTDSSNGKSYYLNMDEAQSLGNVDYMRTAKKIRRTFPKTVNNPEMELEKEVSAMNMSDGSSAGQSSTEGFSGAAATDPQITERRKSDSSLDMFRSMAKEMRK